jgi:hypothetical protein
MGAVSGELLFNVKEWIIFVILLGLILLATEVGFQIGYRMRSTIDDPLRSEYNTIQGAVLGLLALLLGFTFAMSISRYESGKYLVIDESNAIGTTFLRAQFLPDPYRNEVSNLLRRYVDTLLRFYGSGIDPEKLHGANDETERIQNELWSRAVAVGERDPRAVTTGLFIQSLNEVIDLHAKRLWVKENHVPEIIFILLYGAAIVSMGLVGSGWGLGGRRNLMSTVAAALLIASVILVIVDLDRPGRGLIKVNQQSLIRLRDSLNRGVR